MWYPLLTNYSYEGRTCLVSIRQTNTTIIVNAGSSEAITAGTALAVPVLSEIQLFCRARFYLEMSAVKGPTNALYPPLD